MADLSAANISLVSVLTVCMYLFYRCCKAPNPRPAKLYKTDRIQMFTVDTRATEILAAAILLFITVYHSALILFPESRADFCLNPDLLDEDLFSWSRQTAGFILFVLFGASIRLMAYTHLGQNFTFRLAKPKGIVTTGIYHYMQHPSYTGVLMLILATFFIFVRVDGLGACFLPSRLASYLANVAGINIAMWVANQIFALVAFSMRVKDEEGMLQKEFGKEWEEYHRRTKRFLPGII